MEYSETSNYGRNHGLGFSIAALAAGVVALIFMLIFAIFFTMADYGKVPETRSSAEIKFSAQENLSGEAIRGALNSLMNDDYKITSVYGGSPIGSEEATLIYYVQISFPAEISDEEGQAYLRANVAAALEEDLGADIIDVCIFETVGRETSEARREKSLGAAIVFGVFSAVVVLAALTLGVIGLIMFVIAKKHGVTATKTLIFGIIGSAIASCELILIIMMILGV